MVCREDPQSGGQLLLPLNSDGDKQGDKQHFARAQRTYETRHFLDLFVRAVARNDMGHGNRHTGDAFLDLFAIEFRSSLISQRGWARR